ncbi:MAG: DNA recombination protein RmuC [Bryobacterales bacterium]|nr:DNA recombination protein RmuC [Bryobacterales bacterium]
MIYPGVVMPWFAFIAGLLAGGLIAGLWMRAKLARLEAARQFAEFGAAKLQGTFQALADAALRSNQSAFLDAARTTLETTRVEMSADLAQRHTAIEGVVQPLADSLVRLETQVRELERTREKAFGSLGEQVQTLARETATLSTALRSPQTRGRWGEVTLRRVAELAGMVHNCDFQEQETREADGLRIRPDMTVRLPSGRSLVVDAKVPLTAYLDAVGAADEISRKNALLRHGQQVAEHVRQLSSKQYWNQFQPAPELVVLFLPGDHFFSAALEIRPDLIEEALAKKVVIATPVTLISVLKGIAYGWNQEQLAENAEEIRRVASEMYERVQLVQEHYSDTGRLLEKTVEAYNRSVGSWDARLVPALRKMRELGVSNAGEPQAPEQIDLLARRPRAVNGF